MLGVLGSTVPSQSPPASPSAPARALMSVSRICACKHLSSGCFSHGALPQGCALPGPASPCPYLSRGHAISRWPGCSPPWQALALVWVPGAGCAAAGNGCLVEQCGMRSCCWGPPQLLGDWDRPRGDLCCTLVLAWQGRKAQVL